MTEREARIAIIEEVLIYHHKRKVGGDLICTCGYVFPIGKSVERHRAVLIDSALAYAEEGQL